MNMNSQKEDLETLRKIAMKKRLLNWGSFFDRIEGQVKDKLNASLDEAQTESEGEDGFEVFLDPKFTAVNEEHSKARESLCKDFGILQDEMSSGIKSDEEFPVEMISQDSHYIQNESSDEEVTSDSDEKLPLELISQDSNYIQNDSSDDEVTSEISEEITSISQVSQNIENDSSDDEVHMILQNSKSLENKRVDDEAVSDASSGHCSPIFGKKNLRNESMNNGVVLESTGGNCTPAVGKQTPNNSSKQRVDRSILRANSKKRHGESQAVSETDEDLPTEMLKRDSKSLETESFDDEIVSDASSDRLSPIFDKRSLHSQSITNKNVAETTSGNTSPVFGKHILKRNSKQRGNKDYKGTNQSNMHKKGEALLSDSLFKETTPQRISRFRLNNVKNGIKQYCNYNEETSEEDNHHHSPAKRRSIDLDTPPNKQQKEGSRNSSKDITAKMIINGKMKQGPNNTLKSGSPYRSQKCADGSKVITPKDVEINDRREESTVQIINSSLNRSYEVSESPRAKGMTQEIRNSKNHLYDSFEEGTSRSILADVSQDLNCSKEASIEFCKQYDLWKSHKRRLSGQFGSLHIVSSLDEKPSDENRFVPSSPAVIQKPIFPKRRFSLQTPKR